MHHIKFFTYLHIVLLKFTIYNQLNALDITYHVHIFTYIYISCQKFKSRIFFKNFNIQSKEFSI